MSRRIARWVVVASVVCNAVCAVHFAKGARHEAAQDVTHRRATIACFLRLRGGTEAGNSSLGVKGATVEVVVAVAKDLTAVNSTSARAPRDASALDTPHNVSRPQKMPGGKGRSGTGKKKRLVHSFPAKRIVLTPSSSAESYLRSAAASTALVLQRSASLIMMMIRPVLAVLAPLRQPLMAVHEHVGGLVFGAVQHVVDGVGELVSLHVEGTVAYQDGGLYGILMWARNEWHKAEEEEEEEEEDRDENLLPQENDSRTGDDEPIEPDENARDKQGARHEKQASEQQSNPPPPSHPLSAVFGRAASRGAQNGRAAARGSCRAPLEVQNSHRRISAFMCCWGFHEAF